MLCHRFVAGLRTEIERDVKARKALETDNSMYGSRFEGINQYKFEVVKEGNKILERVSFDRQGNRIIISNLNKLNIPGEVFEILLTLNAKRECCYLFKDLELESWQLRKLALEDLFFG
jgi:hypothetical protein